MQCCQVYECIRTLRIYGVQREPEIDGGLLHNPRILPNILLLNVHARVSEGTADSELESLLGEPLLPREVSPGILQAVGLSNPLALSFLCRRFVARIFRISCAEGGLKNPTKHGDTGGHQRREKSSAEQRTGSAVF